MLLSSDYTISIIDTIWPIAFISILTIALYVFRSKIRESKMRQIIPYILLILMIVFEYYLFTGMYDGIRVSFKAFIGSIPMHLCSMSAIMVMVYSISRKEIVLDVIIFQGVIGALVTFAFPDMTHNPSQYLYWKFFFSHSVLYITPIYFFIIEKKQVNRATLRNALVALHIFGILAMIINLYADKNYMYISNDNTHNLFSFLPIQEVLPFLATFPGVLLFGEILSLTVYFALYLVYRKIQENLT